jgi:hypothetical protein
MDPSPRPNPRRNLPLATACAAVLLLLFLASGSAQPDPSPATDAAALIRRAVANHMTAAAAHHPQRFVLHRKDDRRDFIQEIIETRQGDVSFAIAASGTPLNPEMHQAQIDRLNDLDAHPDHQEHRRKHEQEDTDRANKLMRMLPDAFIYHYDSTIPCAVSTPPAIPIPGVQSVAQSAEASPAPSACYHLTFKPSPNWDPPDIEAKILRGMEGEVLIEKSQERLTSLNAHLVTDVDFGWGIVGHLNKGGTVFLEQTQMAPNDWELSRMKLNFTGKALLFKTLNVHLTEEMAHYAPVPPNLDYHQAIQMLKSEPAPH